MLYISEEGDVYVETLLGGEKAAVYLGTFSNRFLNFFGKSGIKPPFLAKKHQKAA